MKWLSSGYRYSSKESKKINNPGLSLQKCQLLEFLFEDGSDQALCFLPYNCFLLSSLFSASKSLCCPGGVVLHHSSSLPTAMVIRNVPYEQKKVTA